mmetsp:Transcript_33658/g.106385  ORF Transcript_33658/g.106385 Transcript_33658/m.106385 type:complete len:88 (+) Transcript_33658:1502-1765(+)
MKNIGMSYGGAITAALYLAEFVKKPAANEEESAGDEEDDAEAAPKAPKWLHMDVMAYNQGTRPGRPEGGEAQGMRAFFALLEKKYAS